MCEAGLAKRAAIIINSVRSKPVVYPWLLGAVETIREAVGDPDLKVKDMRGEALGLYLDAQLQFLVEQTGSRATMTRRRMRDLS